MSRNQYAWEYCNLLYYLILIGDLFIGTARGSVSGCSPLDRSIFNANIIQLFSLEYDRIPQTSAAEPIGDQKGGIPIKNIIFVFYHGCFENA